MSYLEVVLQSVHGDDLFGFPLHLDLQLGARLFEQLYLEVSLLYSFSAYSLQFIKLSLEVGSQASLQLFAISLPFMLLSEPKGIEVPFQLQELLPVLLRHPLIISRQIPIQCCYCSCWRGGAQDWMSSWRGKGKVSMKKGSWLFSERVVLNSSSSGIGRGVSETQRGIYSTLS